jgi:hypothetical protein
VSLILFFFGLECLPLIFIVVYIGTLAVLFLFIDKFLKESSAVPHKGEPIRFDLRPQNSLANVFNVMDIVDKIKKTREEILDLQSKLPEARSIKDKRLIKRIHNKVYERRVKMRKFWEHLKKSQ